MAVDLQVEWMCYGSIDLVFMPLMGTISLAILWMYLGPAVITGAVMIMLYVPVNIILMTKFGDFQVI